MRRYAIPALVYNGRWHTASILILSMDYTYEYKTVRKYTTSAFFSISTTGNTNTATPQTVKVITLIPLECLNCLSWNICVLHVTCGHLNGVVHKCLTSVIPALHISNCWGNPNLLSSRIRQNLGFHCSYKNVLEG
jgi:hypothetical protein